MAWKVKKGEKAEWRGEIEKERERGGGGGEERERRWGKRKRKLRLTTVVTKPSRLQVEWWTYVENVRILAL